MASITILPKLNKIDENNVVPLYIRIIKNRKTRFISLGVKIDLKHWDSKRSQVKSSHPTSTRLNYFLSSKLVETQDLVLESETVNKYITPAQLKVKVLGIESTTFTAYFTEHIERKKKLQKIGTFPFWRCCFHRELF